MAACVRGHEVREFEHFRRRIGHRNREPASTKNRKIRKIITDHRGLRRKEREIFEERLKGRAFVFRSSDDVFHAEFAQTMSQGHAVATSDDRDLKADFRPHPKRRAIADMKSLRFVPCVIDGDSTIREDTIDIETEQPNIGGPNLK